jgi:hypothetical protein
MYNPEFGLKEFKKVKQSHHRPAVDQQSHHRPAVDQRVPGS